MSNNGGLVFRDSQENYPAGEVICRVGICIHDCRYRSGEPARDRFVIEAGSEKCGGAREGGRGTPQVVGCFMRYTRAEGSFEEVEAWGKNLVCPSVSKRVWGRREARFSRSGNSPDRIPDKLVRRASLVEWWPWTDTDLHPSSLPASTDFAEAS